MFTDVDLQEVQTANMLYQATCSCVAETLGLM